MPSISASELSRRIGRSRAAILKLARRSTIPRNPDGSFDEAAVRRAYARNTDPSWRKPLKGDLAPPTPVVPEAEPRHPLHPNAIVVAVLTEEGLVVDGTVSLEDAKMAEAVLRCRKIAADIAEIQREYVPRAPTQRHIAEAFANLQASIQAMPSSNAAQLAAKLGRDRTDVEAALSSVFIPFANSLSPPRV